jgi:hypothetical protein
MEKIKTEETIGKTLATNIINIAAITKREVDFKRGYIIEAKDALILFSIRRHYLWIEEGNFKSTVHEDDAAKEIIEMGEGGFIDVSSL